MKHKIIIFAIILINLSCRISFAQKDEINMYFKNPTTYDFNTSYDSVRDIIIKKLDRYKFNSAVLKERENPDKHYDQLYVETSEKLHFSKEVLSKPENKDDIYLYTFLTLAPSSVYYSKKKKEPLDFNAAYHIKLKKLDNYHTRVSIITLNYTVITGYKRIPVLGMCGFWRPPLEYKLPVTTVEEYELLQRIGFFLGEKEMPPIVIPPKLYISRKGTLK